VSSRSRRTLRLLVLHRVLDGERILELTASRIRRWSEVKKYFFRVVQGDHANTPFKPSSGTASAEFSVLYLEVSFRYPGSTEGLPFRIGLRFCATQPRALSHRDAQRSKQPEVIAIHIFRHQFVAMPDVDGIASLGIARRSFTANTKAFRQAERGSEVLAEFEKSLRFLACRCDRTEKCAPAPAASLAPRILRPA